MPLEGTPRPNPGRPRPQSAATKKALKGSMTMEEAQQMVETIFQLRAEVEKPTTRMVMATLDTLLMAMAPIQMVLENAQAQIEMETAGDTIEGVRSVLDMMQGEEFQNILNAFSGMLSTLFSAGTVFTNALNYFVNETEWGDLLITAFTDMAATLKKFAAWDIGSLIQNPLEYIAKKFTNLYLDLDPDDPGASIYQGLIPGVSPRPPSDYM